MTSLDYTTMGDGIEHIVVRLTQNLFLNGTRPTGCGDIIRRKCYCDGTKLL